MFELLLQEFEPPVRGHPEVDPKTVASIILGGGAGTRLFPLTSRRAKPAVSDYLMCICDIFFLVYIEFLLGSM